MPSDFAMMHTGGGTFVCRRQRDREAADEKFPVGAHVRGHITKPRSIKEHDTFFGWLAKVFDNLPEDDDQFKDAEHLRHWLLCRAGYCAIKNVPAECAQEILAEAVIAVLRDSKCPTLFFERRRSTLWIKSPLSMAMDKMRAAEFRAFFRQAQEIVEVELLPGVTIDQLLTSLRKDAA